MTQEVINYLSLTWIHKKIIVLFSPNNSSLKNQYWMESRTHFLDSNAQWNILQQSFPPCNVWFWFSHCQFQTIAKSMTCLIMWKLSILQASECANGQILFGFEVTSLFKSHSKQMEVSSAYQKKDKNLCSMRQRCHPHCLKTVQQNIPFLIKSNKRDKITAKRNVFQTRGHFAFGANFLCIFCQITLERRKYHLKICPIWFIINYFLAKTWSFKVKLHLGKNISP